MYYHFEQCCTIFLLPLLLLDALGQSLERLVRAPLLGRVIFDVQQQKCVFQSRAAVFRVGRKALFDLRRAQVPLCAYVFRQHIRLVERFSDLK